MALMSKLPCCSVYSIHRTSTWFSLAATMNAFAPSCRKGISILTSDGMGNNQHTAYPRVVVPDLRPVVDKQVDHLDAASPRCDAQGSASVLNA